MQNREIEIQVWRGQELVSTESLDPGSYTIGRAASCDIVLPSPEVSRRHAHLEYRDGSWYLEDLASPNGMFQYGERIPIVELEDDAQIALDPFLLVIRIGERTDAVTHMKGAIPQPSRPVHVVLLTTFPPVRIPITARVTCFGRAHKDVLPLEDPHISRTHALLRRVRGEYVIEDRDSANGTWVRGERVHSRRLSDGDEIRLGAHLIRFELG